MIDSMLYQLKVPAGAYTAGQKIAMPLVRGPSVVRDGNGKATLKRIFTIADGSGVDFNVHVTNGSWVDEVINPAPPVYNGTQLISDAKNIQSGHDCELQINSAFSVVAEVYTTKTSTVDFSVYCLIDIEYDAIPAVIDPRNQKGTPMTIQMAETVPGSVAGSDLTWTTLNKDLFKAGYKYLLTEVGTHLTSAAVTCTFGFLSITGAAGQAGLERIIPMYVSSASLAFPIDYSTVLVKGPMNVNLAYVVAAAGNADVDVQLDFVRRG